MNVTDAAFSRANYLIRKQAHARWHQLQCKQQILRSQVGFNDTSPSRPKPCEGCTNYHGLRYGTTRTTRTTLVCAMHPYGWQTGGHCPDWQGSD